MRESRRVNHSRRITHGSEICCNKTYNGQLWVPGNDPTHAYRGYEVIVTNLVFALYWLFTSHIEPQPPPHKNTTSQIKSSHLSLISHLLHLSHLLLISRNDIYIFVLKKEGFWFRVGESSLSVTSLSRKAACKGH